MQHGDELVGNQLAHLQQDLPCEVADGESGILLDAQDEVEDLVEVGLAERDQLPLRDLLEPDIGPLKDLPEDREEFRGMLFDRLAEVLQYGADHAGIARFEQGQEGRKIDFPVLLAGQAGEELDCGDRDVLVAAAQERSHLLRGNDDLHVA